SVGSYMLSLHVALPIAVSEVEFLMTDGGAKIFIAEDQEYVDKILQIADRLPGLNWIVVIDDSAMFDYSHPKLISLSDIESRVARSEEHTSELQSRENLV